MSWQQKMKDGIKLCMEACQENTDWTKCHNECEFDEWCTTLMDAKVIDPYKGIYARLESDDI